MTENVRFINGKRQKRKQLFSLILSAVPGSGGSARLEKMK